MIPSAGTLPGQPPPIVPPPIAKAMDVEAVRLLAAQRRALIEQIIVGQKKVVDDALMTIFCGGHALIVGVPGLAKTLLVRSLGQALALSFNRIQFTPDLM